MSGFDSYNWIGLGRTRPSFQKKPPKPSKEKYSIMRTKQYLTQKIDEINARKYNYIDVNVKYEFEIKKKTGEVIEYVRSRSVPGSETKESSRLNPSVPDAPNWRILASKERLREIERS